MYFIVKEKAGEPMTEDNLLKDVKNFINEKIAPGVQSHGGEIEVVSFKDNILTVSLSGACGSCSILESTSETVSDFILEEFPDIDDVYVIEPEV